MGRRCTAGVRRKCLLALANKGTFNPANSFCSLNPLVSTFCESEAMIDRRTLLIGSAALSFAPALAAPPDRTMVFGPEVPFSFDALTGRAKELSQRPYQKPVIPDFDLLERLDFDAYQEIRFRPELGDLVPWRRPLPNRAVSPRPLFQRAGPHFHSLRAGCREGGALQPRSLHLRQERLRQNAAAGCGLRRLQGVGRAGRNRLARILGRFLFQIAGGNWPIRALLAGACHRCCHADAGRVPAVYELLA